MNEPGAHVVMALKAGSERRSPGPSSRLPRGSRTRTARPPRPGAGHAAGDERVTRGDRLELPVAVVPPEAHGGAVQWLVGAIGCAISPLSRRDRAQGGPRIGEAEVGDAADGPARVRQVLRRRLVEASAIELSSAPNNVAPTESHSKPVSSHPGGGSPESSSPGGGTGRLDDERSDLDDPIVAVGIESVPREGFPVAPGHRRRIGDRGTERARVHPPARGLRRARRRAAGLAAFLEEEVELSGGIDTRADGDRERPGGPGAPGPPGPR